MIRYLDPRTELCSFLCAWKRVSIRFSTRAWVGYLANCYARSMPDYPADGMQDRHFKCCQDQFAFVRGRGAYTYLAPTLQKTAARLAGMARCKSGGKAEALGIQNLVRGKRGAGAARKMKHRDKGYV